MFSYYFLKSKKLFTLPNKYKWISAALLFLINLGIVGIYFVFYQRIQLKFPYSQIGPHKIVAYSHLNGFSLVGEHYMFYALLALPWIFTLLVKLFFLIINSYSNVDN